jgi:hypothetical protein
VLDTERVADPGNYGFEVFDDGPPGQDRITIREVAVIAPDRVRVTLSGDPLGSTRRIRYAFTGTPGMVGGPRSGPRGNLRDSDATPSRSGHDLYDWCVIFDEPLP